MRKKIQTISNDASPMKHVGNSIAFAMPKEDYELLTMWAGLLGLSMAEITRRAIRLYLADVAGGAGAPPSET